MACGYRPLQGRAKTTSFWASSGLGSSRADAAAATMATYCLPSRPRYVIGLANALISSRVTQSSSPVRESKARNRRSLVAPMKTSPACGHHGSAHAQPSCQLPVLRQLFGDAQRDAPGNIPRGGIHRDQVGPGRLVARPGGLAAAQCAASRFRWRLVPPEPRQRAVDAVAPVVSGVDGVFLDPAEAALVHGVHENVAQRRVGRGAAPVGAADGTWKDDGRWSSVSGRPESVGRKRSVIAEFRPLCSTTRRQNCACASVVSSALTISSGENATLAMGGGLTGMGWVGELASSGTLLWGTGRSSIPNTGSPFSRLSMYM